MSTLFVQSYSPQNGAVFTKDLPITEFTFYFKNTNTAGTQTYQKTFPLSPTTRYIFAPNAFLSTWGTNPPTGAGFTWGQSNLDKFIAYEAYGSGYGPAGVYGNGTYSDEASFQTAANNAANWLQPQIYLPSSGGGGGNDPRVDCILEYLAWAIGDCNTTRVKPDCASVLEHSEPLVDSVPTPIAPHPVIASIKARLPKRLPVTRQPLRQAHVPRNPLGINKPRCHWKSATTRLLPRRTGPFSWTPRRI